MDRQFEGVTQHVRLPDFIDIPAHEKIFKIDEEAAEKVLPVHIRKSFTDLVTSLNADFKMFRDPEHFDFYLPESKFEAVADLDHPNTMNYATKVVGTLENTFRDRLSEEQINQIEQRGEFEVRSNRQYIIQPYVWRINRALFWGKEKMKEVWIKGLAQIYEYVYLSFETFKSMVPARLNKIVSAPYSLYNLIFGAKSLEVAIAPNYEEEIAMDFWERVMKNCYKGSEQEGHALWEYLNLKYEARIDLYNVKLSEQQSRIRQEQLDQEQKDLQKKKNIRNTIATICNEFETEWSVISTRIFREVCEQNEEKEVKINMSLSGEEQRLIKQREVSNEELILQKFQERKFVMYLAEMQKKLPSLGTPPQVIQAIITVLRLMQCMSIKVRNSDKQLSKKLEDCLIATQNEYPILQHAYSFFQKEINLRQQPLKEQHNSQLYESLTREYRLQSHHGILKELMTFIKERSHLIARKKMAYPVLMRPTRIFESFYMLLPPYEVYQRTGYYYLKTESDQLTVDTSQHFWKLRLYWMRAKTWTKNYLIIMAHSLWESTFGFRCLYGVKDFAYDPYINSATGEITYRQRSTVLGTFFKTWDGIVKSRQHFESLPDEGLFGKRFARVFNYMECYVFRLVFVGVLLVLICYPIAIIVVSTVSMALLITFWIWVPFIFLLTYLFNILLFQFETAYLERSCLFRFFPLVRIGLGLLVNIVVMVMVVVYTVLVVPLFSVCWLVLRVLQRGCRTVADSVLLCLIRHLGRTPSQDTMIARKISGPGMSRSFYFSINESDVYVLVQAQLEILYLQKLGEVTERVAGENVAAVSACVSTILSTFGACYSRPSVLQTNLSAAKQRFWEQYRLYAARYPEMPTQIRFTQAEIDVFFPNTLRIVENFVEKRKIGKWVFKEYNLEQGAYEDLTRAVWVKVFNCGEDIFTPLQQIDQRFSIENQFQEQENRMMKSSINHVMEAIKGQVQLSRRTVKVRPLKNKLMSRVEPICLFRSHIQCVPRQQIPPLNIFSIFVPHLNIVEAVKKHVFERESREKRMREKSVLMRMEMNE